MSTSPMIIDPISEINTYCNDAEVEINDIVNKVLSSLRNNEIQISQAEMELIGKYINISTGLGTERVSTITSLESLLEIERQNAVKNPLDLKTQNAIDSLESYILETESIFSVTESTIEREYNYGIYVIGTFDHF